MQGMVISVFPTQNSMPDSQKYTLEIPFLYDHRSEHFNRKIHSSSSDLPSETSNGEMRKKNRPLKSIDFLRKTNILENNSKKSHERQNISSLRNSSNKYAYVKSKVDSNIENLYFKNRKLRSLNFGNEGSNRLPSQSLGYLQRQRNIMSALPAYNRNNIFQIEQSMDSPSRSKSATNLRNSENIGKESSSELSEVDSAHGLDSANLKFDKYLNQDNSFSNFDRNELISKSNKTFVNKERYSQVLSRFESINSMSDNATTNSTIEDPVLLAFLRDDPQLKSWSYNMSQKFDQNSKSLDVFGESTFVDNSQRRTSIDRSQKRSSTFVKDYSYQIKKNEMKQRDQTDQLQEFHEHKYNAPLEIKNKMLSLIDSLNLHTLKSNIIDMNIEGRRTLSAISSANPHSERNLGKYHIKNVDLSNWDYLRNRPLAKSKKSVRVALENNRLHLYTPEYDRPRLSYVYP